MPRYLHHTLTLDSRALRGNPLGDPHERALHVLAPEGVHEKLPVLWVLTGWGGTASQAVLEDQWEEGLRARVQRLADEGALPPCLVVVPDLFTAYGGCQFLSSEGTGDYERYLWGECVDAVRARFPAGRHGALGKSSGGYGALLAAMRQPGLIEAVAAHAPDVAFELSIRPELGKLCAATIGHADLAAFLHAFRASPKKRDGRWFSPMSVLCLAACWSPDASADGGVALPVELATGRLVPEVWARWLAFDPLQLVEQEAHRRALAGLALLHLDAGRSDEFLLQLGLRQLVAKLTAAGIPHEHEEFEGGHRGLSSRYDVSLPKLARGLAARG